MAGHSQFKNIMVRKGKQDAKRAKAFTKIAREIAAACRLGMPDPDHNPRLRAAVLKARSENIPNDKIRDAIKRASGADNAETYDEVRYEGYGPGGVAIIIEALTDNRNRTASEIRSIFTKAGSAMGESGSVSFMFDRLAVIQYPAEAASEDAMLDAAIEAGADNAEFGKDGHTISCSVEQFGAVRDAMEAKFGAPSAARILWQPRITATVDEEQAKLVLKLIDTLEDNDDVQEVYSNFEISEEIMERLSA